MLKMMSTDLSIIMKFCSVPSKTEMEIIVEATGKDKKSFCVVFMVVKVTAKRFELETVNTCYCTHSSPHIHKYSSSDPHHTTKGSLTTQKFETRKNSYA